MSDMLMGDLGIDLSLPTDQARVTKFKIGDEVEPLMHAERLNIYGYVVPW